MAKRKFILQGFTSSVHARAVRALFTVPDIKQVTLSVAFVSESGVQQIEEQLKAHATNLIVFAGIRNDITSYQGLALLHSIIGSNLYVVDTGSRNILFHPKLYLARGEAQARLIVSSANLTVGGLNNNIEAGMMLDLDLTDADDKAIVYDIESQFAALPSDYPFNVLKVSSVGELDDLLASGRIVDETVISAPRPVATTARTGASDTVPPIKLKVTPLRHPLAKVSRTPTKVRTSKSITQAKSGVPTSVHGIATVGTEFELVWESKPLERRDLNIPEGDKANKTGSMNLDKGLLLKEVDHRHYFRDIVFSALTWKSRSKTVDEACAKFRLIVKGINHGEFNLSIHHTTSTTSPSYKQRNAMTRLSWGPMRKYINWPDLIGRTLSLYRDKIDPTRFILEID
ncbi:MAG TPA: hypothetical protein VJS44_00960 [Pyrinomonadaceae bacterium]|nr:hypothetical protein [Pyrinomonadaceae bacterium]